MGLLADISNCVLCMRREFWDSFSMPTQVSDPNMHHGTCMTGSLISGFRWSWWRGKRSRHSRRMHNPQFYVSGKGPIIGRKRVENHIGRVITLNSRNPFDWKISKIQSVARIIYNRKWNWCTSNKTIRSDATWVDLFAYCSCMLLYVG